MVMEITWAGTPFWWPKISGTAVWSGWRSSRSACVSGFNLNSSRQFILGSHGPAAPAAIPLSCRSVKCKREVYGRRFDIRTRLFDPLIISSGRCAYGRRLHKPWGGEGVWNGRTTP